MFDQGWSEIASFCVLLALLLLFLWGLQTLLDRIAVSWVGNLLLGRRKGKAEEGMAKSLRGKF